jgi:hypothetical protein
MRKFLIKILEFLFRKDTKTPRNTDYEQHLELYKIYHHAAHECFKKIRKERLRRLLKHHKFALMRIFIAFCIATIGIYFTVKNYYPKFVHILQLERMEAAYQKDSIVIIKWVINPKLIKYLDAIAATESAIIDQNKNGKIDYEDTLTAYHRRCLDTSSSALGRYQMTKAAREAIGLGKVSDEIFRNWPELQDIACYQFLRLNMKVMKPFIKKYDGKIINGYFLTEPGMISMAHALGADGTMQWIKNGCKDYELPKGAPKAYRRLTFQKYRITFK